MEFTWFKPEADGVEFAHPDDQDGWSDDDDIELRAYPPEDDGLWHWEVVVRRVGDVADGKAATLEEAMDAAEAAARAVLERAGGPHA